MTSMTASSRRRLVGRKGPAGRSPARNGSENGIALVVSLLLLSLMSVLGIVMMVSVNSDTLINGYYGNYRGSFYAADSGLNIARQQLVNQIAASANTTACEFWATNAVNGCTSPPLSITPASTNAIMAAVTGQYGSFTSLNTGQGTGSWSELFQIANTGNNCNTLSAAQTFPPATPLGTAHVYMFKFAYQYKLCAVGQAHGLQRVNTSESGIITITIQSPNAPLNTPFSSFGGFLGNYPPCLGPLVPGTMGGMMYANGAWQFMTGGSYIFTGAMSQTNPDFDFFVNWGCNPSPTASFTADGQTIAPNFQGGYTLGLNPPLPLPTNAVNQEWAVLDGLGIGETGTPGPQDFINASLRDVNGNLYPTNGASSGVYLPYTGNTLTANAGGIYVEGNAGIQLSTGTDNIGQPTQIYAITQGSTTTTITIDQNAIPATTTVQQNGGLPNVLTGIPHDLVTSTPGTMVYVNGTICCQQVNGATIGLQGPGEGVPAIATNYQTTVTATGDVDITGDLDYTNERVMFNAAGTATCGNPPTTPACTTEELGVYTATGNIVLQSTYQDDNLEVDGSLVAISSQCQNLPSSCGFLVNGAINTFNNVGGQVQYNIFGANLNTENTYFDGSVVPPFFPGTSMPAGPPTPTAPNVTVGPYRMSWVTTPQ
jgi:Tfp pilus assembly protein PilX